jgi:hypothetical protein
MNMRLIRIATMVAFATLAVPAASAKAALVDFWRFDGDLTNEVTTNRYGTAASIGTGSVAFSTNVPAALGAGQSLSLDGLSWVIINSNPPEFSGSFAISYWVNQDGQTQAREYDRVTSRSDNMETGIRAPGGRLIYYSGSSGWVETGYTLPASGWSHVLFTSDGASMRVFVNGTSVSSGYFSRTPSGPMRIGATGYVAYPETIKGKLDDMALWDNSLTPWAARALASGKLLPSDLKTVSVASTPTEWMRSTVRRSGGTSGTDWTPTADPLPAASTFTETASAATDSNILAAGSDLGLGTLLGQGGDNTATGVQYYRTTFQIDPTWGPISANITLASNRGAQIFINGVEVARETTWSSADWTWPYSTLSIDPDGTISGVTLFDWVAASFKAWKPGTNEVIIAVRNADDSTATGGIAFRMDIVATIPEPATWGLFAAGGAGLLMLRRRSPRSSGRP